MSEGIEVNATRDAIQEFKESILWADIVRELKMWKEGFRMEMENIVTEASSDNPSTASVLLHMGDINGRIKTVDYTMNILDVFTQILEDKEDADRRDET